MLSGILKTTQKQGVTFNSMMQDVIDLIQFSKMTMVKQSPKSSHRYLCCFLGNKIIKGCFFIRKLKKI